MVVVIGADGGHDDLKRMMMMKLKPSFKRKPCSADSIFDSEIEIGTILFHHALRC